MPVCTQGSHAHPPGQQSLSSPQILQGNLSLASWTLNSHLTTTASHSLSLGTAGTCSPHLYSTSAGTAMTPRWFLIFKDLFASLSALPRPCFPSGTFDHFSSVYFSF